MKISVKNGTKVNGMAVMSLKRCEVVQVSILVYIRADFYSYFLSTGKSSRAMFVISFLFLVLLLLLLAKFSYLHIFL